MIIAIDGPAGSGKTTIARRLAEKLNILYLDTGATYRALTLKALNDGVDLNDEGALKVLASNLKLKLQDNRVYLDGVDVTDKIRTSLIDRNISRLASLLGVREEMVKIQKTIVGQRDAVVEGRDITTVVFPRAEFKFYLDADFGERLRRRYKELKEKGIETELTELEKDMQRRDSSDLNREVNPLKKADDAIYLDTSNLNIEEVVETMLSYVKK